MSRWIWHLRVLDAYYQRTGRSRVYEGAYQSICAAAGGGDHFVQWCEYWAGRTTKWPVK